MKTLVLYYSRTGNTGKIAEELADALGCDIEEIVDTVDRSGASGYMRSVYHAIMKKPTVLKEMKNDPADFDLVVIGTPVWNMKMSTPIRTYITQNQAKFNNVAFFATASGNAFDGTFRAMEELIGVTPLGTLGVRAKEIKNNSYQSNLEEFIKEIQ
jgi:flavodoxin